MLEAGSKSVAEDTFQKFKAGPSALSSLIGFQGKNYWQKERLVCSCLGRQASEETPKGFTLDDLHAASEGKSFDYRLLNHLLFTLRGVEPDRDLMQFLFVDEHLVDVGDDLLDYEVTFCSSHELELHQMSASRKLHHVYKKQLTEPIFASLSRGDLTEDAMQDDIAKNSFNIYRGRLTQL